MVGICWLLMGETMPSSFTVYERQPPLPLSLWRFLSRGRMTGVLVHYCGPLRKTKQLVRTSGTERERETGEVQKHKQRLNVLIKNHVFFYI